MFILITSSIVQMRLNFQLASLSLSLEYLGQNKMSMHVIFLDPILVMLKLPSLNICKSLTKAFVYGYKLEVLTVIVKKNSPYFIYFLILQRIHVSLFFVLWCFFCAETLSAFSRKRAGYIGQEIYS